MNATRSVILINDPGVDGAFTTSLALLDPRIEIAAVLATPGNVSAQQATRNLRTILDLVDPPRLPRLGIAPPASFDVDGRQLHGANGLAGLQFPAIEPMHSQTSERLLVELARANPETHTVLLMGPATVLASALDREPALPKLLRQVIMVGGSWKSPGNCGPGIDFHFRCDPESAKKVLNAGFNLTLIPLDANAGLVVSPAEMELFSCGTPTGEFLRQLIQSGIRFAASQHGVEGFPMKDMAALLTLLHGDEIHQTPMAVDVETRGEITRGMSVFDTRWATTAQPNASVVQSFPEGLMARYLEYITPRVDLG
ncbi:MAG: nucleoside hydrolase [Gemmataceae bacterium]|nr:nucleoside hydrolase [Gemmataceae bacterium]